MANVLVQESSLQAIAAAIRAKNGTQNTYTPAQMAAAISAIVSNAGLVTPHCFDLDTGFVNGNTWYIGGATVSYSDEYAVTAGRSYLISLGGVIGSRFRALFTTVDLSEVTEQTTGIRIINSTTPSAYQWITYTPEEDGYITITKDNIMVPGNRTTDLKKIVNMV